MSLLTDKLDELGFEENDAAKSYFEQLAADQGMDKGGPYVQHAVYERNGVFVVVEQNTGDENLGGLEATVKYPPVAIIESPKGRIAFNPDDVALAELLIDDLE